VATNSLIQLLNDGSTRTVNMDYYVVHTV